MSDQRQVRIWGLGLETDQPQPEASEVAWAQSVIVLLEYRSGLW